VEADVAPIVEEYFPAAHFVQVAVALVEYVPAGQEVQDVEPAAE